jgi:hypothetical protein
MRPGGFCAILFRTARKSLILNGEMSEWSIEHAWKLIPVALSNVRLRASTHSPSRTSRNNDVHRSVPVNHGVCPGFEGVSDTVLTQNLISLRDKSPAVSFRFIHHERSRRAAMCCLVRYVTARLPYQILTRALSGRYIRSPGFTSNAS